MNTRHPYKEISSSLRRKKLNKPQPPMKNIELPENISIPKKPSTPPCKHFIPPPKKKNSRNFFKWCNLVSFGVYLDQILSLIFF